MKKVILVLIAIVTFTSCDCWYCPVCGEWECNCTCNRNYVRYNDGDYFCAETLLGTWQCDYNTVVGNMTIKEVKFFSGHKCDITYSEYKYPDWYTDTYTYSYTSGYLRFSNGVSNFSFKVDKYLFPELYLRDSFGTYIWRKVRSYGC